MINFDSNICTDFAAATSREWLETNGIGGFASGTISGANTRRYHALLTAATRPPLGRVTLLSKFEETLVAGDRRFELSANQYPGNVYPRGFEYLTSYRLDPFPIWTYDVGGIKLEKRIFAIHGHNTTVCRWKVISPGQLLGDLRLELRPLLSFVDYHHLQHEASGDNFEFTENNGVVTVDSANGLASLHFFHDAKVETTGNWYRNFELAIEKERGFDFATDLFQPFVMTFDLARQADVVISTDDNSPADAAKLEKAEIKRRRELIKLSKPANEFKQQLTAAADQFIVKRGDGHTVIAGYPWFSDWGRDTMIALNGLTLATNRPKIAKGILLEFSKHISQGMLPNRFPDAGDEAEYNTVDATLWYFEAVRAYVEHTGDHAFVKKQLYTKLAEILIWHLRGTRFNIHVDTDGLLYAGEPGVQLTWMDAKIGDLVITPRTGKAVEIQALWYNALRIMAGFAGRFGHFEDESRFIAMADLAKLSFNALFWNEAEGCLFDVIENGNRDASVRPNQIFAVSLPHSMLDADRAGMVVKKVEDELLTPVGLRSLSPKDTRYVSVYIGSPFERDSAYHQGTVWAWLIGGFVDAYRKVNGVSKATEQRVSELLSGFRAHLNQAGVGQISEIFDADAPFLPRGCPAQAWSVAEILRVLKDA
ncbi:MAG: amylo-alpha-1,6-glucosidase [Acidobacteriota bacterium]